jgi:uncharacterized RDD family membrane protein YckC
MEILKKHCVACGEVLPLDSNVCQSCKTTNDPNRLTNAPTPNSVAPDKKCVTANEMKASAASSSANSSTLIEFPGVAARPQWRKELSERVREIQKKRASEAAASNGTEADRRAPTDSQTKSLGLVPTAEPPPLNPIVKKALERIERARQAATAATAVSPRTVRSGRATGAAAQAVALETQAAPPVKVADAPPRPALNLAPVVTLRADEQKADEPLARPLKESSGSVSATEMPLKFSVAPSLKASVNDANVQNNAATPEAQNIKPASAANAPTDVVSISAVAAEIPSASVKEAVTTGSASLQFEEKIAAESSAIEHSTVENLAAENYTSEDKVEKTAPRRVCAEVIDDAYLARREAERLALMQAEQGDDRAPFLSRIAASIFDWSLVLGISMALVFLLHPSSFDLTDARTVAALAAVPIGFAVLYATLALTLAGRTFGMKLFGLSVVNARDGFTPTFGRSLLRAVGYVISLAVCGFGVLYALLDADRRGLHDHLAGTIVVRG